MASFPRGHFFHDRHAAPDLSHQDLHSPREAIPSSSALAYRRLGDEIAFQLCVGKPEPGRRCQPPPVIGSKGRQATSTPPLADTAYPPCGPEPWSHPNSMITVSIAAPDHRERSTRDDRSLQCGARRNPERIMPAALAPAKEAVTADRVDFSFPAIDEIIRPPLFLSQKRANPHYRQAAGVWF
jgi:hypothetical protein